MDLPKMAKRIVKKFEKETLDVIEQEVEKLIEVDGIGSKRIEMIKKAWADQKEIRQVMIFLQSHGVSSAYATKIFKTYGNESIEVVQEDLLEHFPQQLFQTVLIGAKNLLQVDPAALTLVLGHGITSVCSD